MALVAERLRAVDWDRQDDPDRHRVQDRSRDAAQGIMNAVGVGLVAWGAIGAGVWLMWG